MKKFCESSIEHEKYNCSWKEKILPLTKEELKSHQVTKVYYICGKKTLKSSLIVGIIGKLEVVFIIQINIETQHVDNICNSKFNVPNEIPVAFDNGSNYHYHFIIEELAN